MFPKYRDMFAINFQYAIFPCFNFRASPYIFNMFIDLLGSSFNYTRFLRVAHHRVRFSARRLAIREYRTCKSMITNAI